MNLDSVNPFDLPCVRLRDRSCLPNGAGIYFVLSGNATVLYVGKAIGIKSRWQQHHRLAEFRSLPDVTIAWLEVKSVDSLSDIERALICRFRPSLNGTVQPSRNKGSVATRSIAYAHGEVKKPYQLMLTPTALKRVAGIAGAVGISRSEVLERMIRSTNIETLKTYVAGSLPPE